METRILVVDDFSTMRKIIRTNLKSLGFINTFEAENGQKALEVLNNESVDLIISDWNMPVMSGLELLKVVRGDAALKDIPFIMITAEGQKDYVMEAAKAGVSNYVVKPFTPETFSEKIQKVLG